MNNSWMSDSLISGSFIFCHARESGNPALSFIHAAMDTRLRGHDDTFMEKT